jgi:predicted secreted hydrolase
MEPMAAAEVEGYARAVEPRELSFPRDHGPHPEFRTEWWYWTGHLEAPDGRPFGFQLTFFRHALTPEAEERSSPWATRQVYLGHFAVSDLEKGSFHAFERYQRGALGLAGAEVGGGSEPTRVWVGSWEARGVEPGDLLPTRLRAAAGPVDLELTATSAKSPVLNGEGGLSQKGPERGNASYYYSLTRLGVEGRLRLENEAFPVTGQAWMDREWSTSALGSGRQGWDWFALQLDDGREVLWYQIRSSEPGEKAESAGTWVETDGSHRPLGEASLEPLGRWRSPESGAVYPSGWRLRAPSEGLDLEITPRQKDQELRLSLLYWEGAVQVAGRGPDGEVQGLGFAELTGYGQ